MRRAAAQKWRMPKHDAVVVQAGGRTMPVWTRATIEEWAAGQGRPAPGWSVPRT
jgi:hypothetical protein